MGGGYDVGVVGAGIVGLMCAYRLAKMGLRVGVFEAQQAPGLGVTSAQSEVIHVVQLPFSSLKSRLARAGNPLYDELCRELGVPLRRLPALLVVKRRRDLAPLFLGYLYLWLNLRRGGFEVRLLGGRALRRIEPALSDSVVGGVVVGGYGVVDSRALVAKLRERLEGLGVEFHFGCEVVGGRPGVEGYTLATRCGEYLCAFVVDAAGLYADEVAWRLGVSVGRIQPSLGVMAEFSGLELHSIISPFTLRQRGRTKGGGIIPTLRGTYIFGPTFRLIEDKRGDKITGEEVRELLDKFSPLIRHRAEPVRVYAGVRPLSPTGDFVVAEDRSGRVICLVGIESPGLTAAPALAELVAERVRTRLGAGSKNGGVGSRLG